MKREIIPFKPIQRCIEDYQYDLNMYLILDAAQVSDQALSFIHEFQNDSRIEFYSLFSGTTEGMHLLKSHLFFYSSMIQIFSMIRDLTLFIKPGKMNRRSILY